MTAFHIYVSQCLACCLPIIEPCVVVGFKILLT